MKLIRIFSIALAALLLGCMAGGESSYAQTREIDKQKTEAWSYKNAVIVRYEENGKGREKVSFRLENFSDKRLKVSCYISYKGLKVSEIEADIVEKGLSEAYVLYHWGSELNGCNPKYLSVQIEDAQRVDKP
jgi:lipoprotein